MKRPHACLWLVAAMMSFASVARSDSAPKVVIPERVDVADLPAFDAEAFPQERSSAPSPDEWRGARRVRLSRPSHGNSPCRAYRVREWMKIHCESQTAGLRLLAGSTEGVALWVATSLPLSEANPNQLTSMGRSAEMIFPVRPDDRRVFEILAVEFGEWEGFGTASTQLVEEQWLPGARSPEIALLDR